MVSLEQITAAVEKRYDYFSARVIVREALRAASLGEKTSYDGGEVNALLEALPSVGERMGEVVSALQRLTGGDGKAPPEPTAMEAPPEPTADPVATEPAPVEPAPVEPAPVEPEPAEAVATASEESTRGDQPEASDESADGGSKGSKKKKKK